MWVTLLVLGLPYKNHLNKLLFWPNLNKLLVTFFFICRTKQWNVCSLSFTLSKTSFFELNICIFHLLYTFTMLILSSFDVLLSEFVFSWLISCLSNVKIGAVASRFQHFFLGTTYEVVNKPNVFVENDLISNVSFLLRIFPHHRLPKLQSCNCSSNQSVTLFCFLTHGYGFCLFE